MPSDILRNNNDFYIRNGDLAVIENGTSVLQAVIERLRSVANEWFLDAEGLPYFTTILGRPVSFSAVETLILETIVDTPGVALVSYFKARVDTEKREYLIDCTFYSVYDSESPERIATGLPFDSNVIFDLDRDAIEDTSTDPLRDTT